ncbi:MAG: hypothetical protein KGD63_05055 [Candidatus Lokiarchaeota archaeon]|nr:hypothetical protein [Candidatus Lokiarchaeota archaeon]
MKFESFSCEEVLNELLENIPLKDEGIIEIYKVDFFTDKKSLIKKYIVVSELHLEEEELQTVII